MAMAYYNLGLIKVIYKSRLRLVGAEQKMHQVQPKLWLADNTIVL